jgi:hypothetical protein
MRWSWSALARIMMAIGRPRKASLAGVRKHQGALLDEVRHNPIPPAYGWSCDSLHPPSKNTIALFQTPRDAAAYRSEADGTGGAGARKFSRACGRLPRSPRTPFPNCARGSARDFGAVPTLGKRLLERLAKRRRIARRDQNAGIRADKFGHAANVCGDDRRPQASASTTTLGRPSV